MLPSNKYSIDPFVIRTLLLGMEGLMIHLRRDGELSDAQRDRALRALVAIVLRTIAAPGVELPELPGAPR